MTTHEAEGVKSLLPCPFCGHNRTDIESGADCFVYCEACDCEGPSCASVEQAIHTWNCRSPPSGEGEVRRHAEIVDHIWQGLLDKDDRTSPEEYPDMVLISRDELSGHIAECMAEAAWQASKAPTRPAPAEIGMGERERLRAALEEAIEFADQDAQCLTQAGIDMVARWSAALASTVLVEGEKGSSCTESGSTASPKSAGPCKSEEREVAISYELDCWLDHNPDGGALDGFRAGFKAGEDYGRYAAAGPSACAATVDQMKSEEGANTCHCEDPPWCAFNNACWRAFNATADREERERKEVESNRIAATSCTPGDA